MSLGRCISTYNFTSNVKFTCIEPYLIHVLTSSGLETYTMRTANVIHHENTEVNYYCIAFPRLFVFLVLLGFGFYLYMVQLEGSLIYLN